MERIEIKPNMVFLVETDDALPDARKQEILKQWDKIFPNNHLLILKKGFIKILEVKSDSN